MADKKITQLTDLGDALASVDLFHVVDDPSGTPINKKITAENVFNNIPTWLGLNSTSEAITASGSTAPINLTSAVTEVNATSATAPLTLADGANGQIKTVINISSSGTNAVIVTPTNLRGHTSITMNAPGETITLIFKNSNWNIISGHNYTVA